MACCSFLTSCSITIWRDVFTYRIAMRAVLDRKRIVTRQARARQPVLTSSSSSLRPRDVVFIVSFSSICCERVILAAPYFSVRVPGSCSRHCTLRFALTTSSSPYIFSPFARLASHVSLGSFRLARFASRSPHLIARPTFYAPCLPHPFLAPLSPQRDPRPSITMPCLFARTQLTGLLAPCFSIFASHSSCSPFGVRPQSQVLRGFTPEHTARQYLPACTGALEATRS